MSKFDLAGYEYVGCDVVRSVIRRNKEKYETSSVRFFHLDLSRGIHLDADVYLIKDCLQHVSDEEIRSVFSNILGSGKSIISTNDFLPDLPGRRTISLRLSGGYRPFCLSKFLGIDPTVAVSYSDHLSTKRVELIKL